MVAAMKKLSDNEVNQRLNQMAQLLKDADGRPLQGETPHGQTALETAAKVAVIALAILAIQNSVEDEADGI